MGSVCEASCVEELGILGAWASAVLVVSSVLQDETAGRLEFEILSVALSRHSGYLGLFTIYIRSRHPTETPLTTYGHQGKDMGSLLREDVKKTIDLPHSCWLPWLLAVGGCGVVW